MFEKVLVPVELSESGERLAAIAKELMPLGTKHILLLHVSNIRNTLADPVLVRHGQDELGKWRRQIEQCGIPSVETEVIVGVPWVEIVRAAEEDGYDCVLMGSHGKGWMKRTLLGSETESVLRETVKPVLVIKLKAVVFEDVKVCKLTSRKLFKKIVFLTDFSENSQRCVPAIESMVRAEPDELILVHVLSKEGEGRERDQLEALSSHFKNIGFDRVSTRLLKGDPVKVTLETVEKEEPTMIVLGAKGVGKRKDQVFGSVSGNLVKRSMAHVLIIK